jgi:hypothetical protein
MKCHGDVSLTCGLLHRSSRALQAILGVATLESQQLQCKQLGERIWQGSPRSAQRSISASSIKLDHFALLSPA